MTSISRGALLRGDAVTPRRLWSNRYFPIPRLRRFQELGLEERALPDPRSAVILWV
jgi:hypothetical protein